jgi:hypothetical protein
MRQRDGSLAGGTSGHGGGRVADADRERVIDRLKTAFVHGRLDRDELGLRAGLALTARTHADLAAITADLPASPPGAAPLPVRAARPARAGLATGAAVAVIVAALDAGTLVAAITGAAPLLVVFLVFLAIGMTGTALVAALIRGLYLIEAHRAPHADDAELPRLSRW